MQIPPPSGLVFSHDTSLLAPSLLAQGLDGLKPEQVRVYAARSDTYATDYAAFSLPHDTALRSGIHAQVARCRVLNPTVLVLIGIGGSHLGMRAVYEASRGLLYNYIEVPRIYYVDTVDAHAFEQLLQVLYGHVQAGQSLMVIMASKSGTTLESVANLQVMQFFMQQHFHDWAQRIIVITDEGSDLCALAQRESLVCLTIPQRVGGRFSVLSAVGLFPLALLGIDIDALCRGAAQALEYMYHVPDNYAAISAIVIFMHALQGRYVHDTFLFSSRFAAFGAWYRQLLAESIGKDMTRHGAYRPTGILPTVSLGSVDLHSMVQLYLAGPNHITTSFVTLEHEKSMLAVPATSPFSPLAPYLSGSTFDDIMEAIISGTQHAYVTQLRPFVTWRLMSSAPEILGQLLMYKMMEVVYIGHLYNVNPFDQPHVELYKRETRRLLEHGE